MKKTLFAIALVTGGMLTIPAAFAQEAAPAQNAQQGWFVGANAGYADVNRGPYNNGDLAGGIKGGYRYAINPDTAIGAEIGYVYLGRVNAKGGYAQYYDGNAKSKLQGATAGLSLRYSFSPNWYGEVRGGAFAAKGEGLTSDRFYPQTNSFHSTRYYAGVGAGYNIMSNLSVGLSWDYYDGSSQPRKNINLPTNLYSLSAEYRF